MTLWATRRVLRASADLQTVTAGEGPDLRRGWGSPATGAYEHYSIGMELLVSGNPAQAAVRLEKARNLEPTKGSIREALGRAYFAVGRWSEAEAEFRRVVELSPVNDYAHYCLSRTLRKQGRSMEAEAHLKLARAMNPDLPAYRYAPGP